MGCASKTVELIVIIVFHGLLVVLFPLLSVIVVLIFRLHTTKLVNLRIGTEHARGCRGPQSVDLSDVFRVLENLTGRHGLSPPDFQGLVVAAAYEDEWVGGAPCDRIYDQTMGLGKLRDDLSLISAPESQSCVLRAAKHEILISSSKSTSKHKA